MDTNASKSFVSAYDSELNPLAVAEYRFGSLVRSTTNTYVADGRPDTSTVSASGAASVATKHLYDSDSLLETKTENYVAGVKQSETSQSFDAWGRQISSTNSLGEVTSTSYVPSGQLAAGAVSTVVSPKTTTSYTYGNTTEPRALVTGMTITGSSSAGTPFSYVYSGVYDEYARLTSQTGPNGVTQTTRFNDAGQLSSMGYGSVASTVLSWSREYDGYGRVVRELAPDSATSASPKTTVYGYDSSSRLASVSSNGASCFSESYSYNARGGRTSSSVGVCGATTTKTNSFNAESQLTTTGYVYDSLGRNTFIPAVDASANNAGISLSYSLVDQVTSITQNGSTTSFTYDALGRRVNETVGTLTTVRHYSDSSDNPEWTTQQAGANLTTEIYTGSLGAGLAVTTTFKGTIRTSSMQLTDIRGHTVATLDLDSNSVAGWSVYDSFGNPQTSQTNTNLINYSSYGQQERATNTTGLILMGARVYNPETNQFTSKDPIKGGNENSYTYPNDPINGSDFTGLWDGWDTLDAALTVLSIVPIPVVQQVGWIAKGAYLAYRVVSIEIRAINLVTKLRKAEKLGETLNNLKATSAVSSRAGVRWTGSTKKYYGKEGKIYHLKSPKAQYRSPDLKTSSGKVQSNFESRAIPKKNNQWDFNHHVTIERGTNWRP